MIDQEFNYAGYMDILEKVDQIKLSSDPALHSIEYFYKILTEMHDLRLAAAKIMYKVMLNKVRCKTRAAEAVFEYEKKRDKFLATTTFPAAMKSQELRLAHINQDMLPELEAVHATSMAFLKADTFQKLIEHCVAVLDSGAEGVETQKQVYQMSLYLDPSLRAEMKTKGGANP